MKFKYTAEQVAKLINWPIETWSGKCHDVADAMLKANLVQGELTYGHYHGRISKASIFSSSRPFTHHGWIVCGSTIVDPTRWVFEACDPYIYVGPKDDEDYDMGGNRVKRMLLQPPPIFNSKHRSWTVPRHLLQFSKMMLNTKSDVICVPQVMWLANLPLDMLGDFAKPMYDWIINDVGIPAFIPLDNRNHILGKTA